MRDLSSLCKAQYSFARSFGGGADRKLVSFENSSNIQVAGPASRRGFTLAEVLITLGIIGVVAAMTLPVLIQNHRKSVVETTAKKFYTNINQALLMYKTETGDTSTDWYITSVDDYDHYYGKYLKIVDRFSTKYAVNSSYNAVQVNFPDGSGVQIWTNDYRFCPKAKYFDNYKSYGDKCMSFGKYEGYNSSTAGQCVVDNYQNKGVEPYLHGSFDCARINDYDYMCSNYAWVKAMQLNGWRLPKECSSKL